MVIIYQGEQRALLHNEFRTESMNRSNFTLWWCRFCWIIIANYMYYLSVQYYVPLSIIFSGPQLLLWNKDYHCSLFTNVEPEISDLLSKWWVVVPGLSKLSQPQKERRVFPVLFPALLIMRFSSFMLINLDKVLQ